MADKQSDSDLKGEKMSNDPTPSTRSIRDQLHDTVCPKRLFGSRHRWYAENAHPRGVNSDAPWFTVKMRCGSCLYRKTISCVDPLTLMPYLYGASHPAPETLGVPEPRVSAIRRIGARLPWTDIAFGATLIAFVVIVIVVIVSVTRHEHDKRCLAPYYFAATPTGVRPLDGTRYLITFRDLAVTATIREDGSPPAIDRYGYLCRNGHWHAMSAEQKRRAEVAAEKARGKSA